MTGSGLISGVGFKGVCKRFQICFWYKLSGFPLRLTFFCLLLLIIVPSMIQNDALWPQVLPSGVSSPPDLTHSMPWPGLALLRVLVYWPAHSPLLGLSELLQCSLIIPLIKHSLKSGAPWTWNEHHDNCDHITTILSSEALVKSAQVMKEIVRNVPFNWNGVLWCWWGWRLARKDQVNQTA